MLGPVFLLEWRRASARGKHHRLRLAYVAVLTAESLLCLVLLFSRSLTASPLAAFELAFGFLQILTLQHFTLLFLVPAALAAGSIADEKMRGSLTLLLSTPLSPLAIIVGKWLSQATQMLMLALPALPLFCLTAFLSGAPALWLWAGAAGTLLTLAAMTAAGIVASVLCRKTATAVVACYGLFGIAAAACFLLDTWGLWHWQDHLSWEILFRREATTLQIAGLLAVYFGLTFCCLVVAVWRLRPAYERYLSARPVATFRWLWRRPPVSERQPLRWKERFIGELGYLAVLRAVPQSYRKAGVFVLAAVVSLLTAIASEQLFFAQSILFLLLVSLTVAVRASGVICGERERQTWDVILAAPLSSYQIIRGKLWGIIDSARAYMAGYLLPALAASLIVGPLAFVWTLYWWLATWVVLYFLGAIGIQASAGTSNSWRSLLKTITTAGGILLGRWFLVLMPVAGCLNPLAFWWVRPFVGFDVLLWLGLSTFLLAVLFAKTEQILQQAEQTIETERIPDNMLRAIADFGASGNWRPVR
jgi:ABC-type transport system involved in multi-copper enzyme maturation permease subunit